MKAREILIALHIKHEGDWDAIYEDIRDKNIADDLEKCIEGVDLDMFCTILDEDYPERIKHRPRPPFVIQEAVVWNT